MLQNIGLPVLEGLNVDSDVVVEVPLMFTVVLGSNICDCLVDYCVTWGAKIPSSV